MKTKTIVLSAGLAAAAFLLLSSDAFAQVRGGGVNLSGAFTTAGSDLKSYARTGMTIAGFITTVVSLGTAGFKFMQKEPQAVWNIVGVVVGAALFAVAQGL